MKKLLGTFILVTMMSLAAPMTANAAELKDIFNAEYYADSYTDLKMTFGYDEEALYNHFLKYGLKEGRCMSPVLDIVKYRGTYADLEEAFGNDWGAYVNHYFEYGMKEGRNNGTGFNAEYYLNAYGDLKAAFGDDCVLAAKHFVEYGYKEERISQPTIVTASASAWQEPEEQMPPVVYEYDNEGNVIKESYYTNNQLVKVVEYTEEYYGNFTITTTYEYYASKNISNTVEVKDCICEGGPWECDDYYHQQENYIITTSYYDRENALKEQEESGYFQLTKHQWYESGNKKYDYFSTEGILEEYWYYDNENNTMQKSVEKDYYAETTREYDEAGNVIAETIE